jgi:serine protease Do
MDKPTNRTAAILVPVVNAWSRRGSSRLTLTNVARVAYLAFGVALLAGTSPALAGGDFQQASLVTPNGSALQAPTSYAAPTRPVNIAIVGGNDRQHDSRGTGFLVARDTWVTAAHVVRGCAAVYVKGDRGWNRARSVSLHPSADLAVINARSSENQTALPLADRDPVIVQPGIHIGFAHGQLVYVETSLSAAASVRQVEQPQAGTSTGWLWQQRGEGMQDSRLGGISGGPQLDASGVVQGVTISYVSGPIRVTTVPAATLRGFLPADTRLADPRASYRLASNSNAVPQTALANSVTSIHCAVSPRSRLGN